MFCLCILIFNKNNELAEKHVFKIQFYIGSLEVIDYGD